MAATACGGGAASPAPAETAGETIRNCDVDVAAENPPERVFAAYQPGIEMAHALGIGDRLVGTAFLDAEVLEPYVQAQAEQEYHPNLPSREELNAQADLNVWRNWQVFVAAQRDLQGGQFLNTEYGFGYEDECLAISLAYRRKYTSDAILGLPPSTSVILRFNLKTGDSEVQPFSLFPRDVFALTHP